MDEQVQRETRFQVGEQDDLPVDEGATAAAGWDEPVAFSRRERQRLLFLRWLYQTGRLTEACA